MATHPGDRRLAYLRRLAAEHDIAIRQVDAQELVAWASGTTHGGVVALAGERRYLSQNELLVAVAPAPLLFMLDGVEDPFNYGQAIRSVHAAGADGLLVRPRTWEHAAGVVARASAGASELLPTATVESAEEAAAAARAVGITVACATTRADAVWLHDADLTGAILVVIGGERRGVTRSFIDEAEVRLRIPYGRRGAHALGVAASAAVIAFEALRQRRAASAVRLARGRSESGAADGAAASAERPARRAGRRS